jgi:GNAT superfamily N-acetyltransferase
MYLPVRTGGCWNVAVDHKSLLRIFDQQMRRDPAGGMGTEVEREDRVTRVVSTGEGWNAVVWSDLTADDADATIHAQIQRFEPVSRDWEWKYYSYDQPVDLPRRLISAGLIPDEAEALLVADIADLDLDVAPPPGVELVPVRTEADAAALVRVHDTVFGGDHSVIGTAILAGLRTEPHAVEAVLAVANGTPISAGRVEFPEEREFATIWGGGTLPAWRGRGVFRSLVAYRARLAKERGYRYLQVDASPDSRPILRRLGFAELGMSIPFRMALCLVGVLRRSVARAAVTRA